MVRVFRDFPGFLLFLLAPSLALTSSAQSRQQTKSEAVRDCDNIKDCVEDVTSLVVVYVYDVEGTAVADMTVAAAREDADVNSPPVVTAKTDRDGMAALSVRPGQSYSIRI